jgi:virulence factor Mce-like protein
MRRLALIAVGLIALAGFVLVASGAYDREVDDQSYVVELDNAFGLIEGGDVKVANVRAGRVTDMEVQKEPPYRARIGITIDQEGFGSLRKDTFCESRPQSLIGEYFLDCTPGRAEELIEPGDTIPVEQTASTIPVDLLNNIMRRPYRERFSILLSEFGIALAGRGPDLNETIRRAVPALRATNRVLAELRDQRRVIRDLTANADRVIGELADNHTDVTRFVQEARDTAAASAERRDDLAAQFRRLPRFLQEFRPTMAALEDVADAQIPALNNLNRSADDLEEFLTELGPFADASRPAFRSLGEASPAGRAAMRATAPHIPELAAAARPLEEIGRNLYLVLDDLNDRDRSINNDPRSPGGQGYSGIEAILSYLFNQSQAINLYDSTSYLLKVSAFVDEECSDYADAEAAREPEKRKCHAILGPTQPGVNAPDPSRGNNRSESQETRDRRDPRPSAREAGPQVRSSSSAPRSGRASTRSGGGQASARSGGGKAASARALPKELRQSLPKSMGGSAPDGEGQQGSELLDYLLAP